MGNLCFVYARKERSVVEPPRIGENKGAEQIRSNCEADQRLWFRHTDSTFLLLLSF